MGLPIVVAIIAASAAVISAVISSQRVPSTVRQLEKLAAAAGAIDASPETRRRLDEAIRGSIPGPRIMSLWPDALAALTVGAIGAAATNAVLVLDRAFKGLRWDTPIQGYGTLITAGLVALAVGLLVIRSRHPRDQGRERTAGELVCVRTLADYARPRATPAAGLTGAALDVGRSRRSGLLVRNTR